MKIQPITNPNILKAYMGATPIADKAKGGAKRDEVTFSKEALDFSKAMAQAQENVETRSSDERMRIDNITTAVRQGEYHVSSEAIADKILESVFRK